MLKTRLQTVRDGYEAEKVKGATDIERKVGGLQSELDATKKENEKLKKEKAKLETMLQKQREDNSKLYEKGKTILFTEI